jgi:hypothetical protein
MPFDAIFQYYSTKKFSKGASFSIGFQELTQAKRELEGTTEVHE